MRNLLSGSLIAAAFGTAVMVASALPASAQVVRAQSAFNTGGNDGRVGNQTMQAVKNFQMKTNLTPADGYPGLKVLARLRQGN